MAIALDNSKGAINKNIGDAFLMVWKFFQVRSDDFSFQIILL
jgi:hypothetical protein